MEPSGEDIAGFSTMAAVLLWAGVVGDPSDETSEVASLLAHVGFTPEDHPRYAAALSKERWEFFLKDWVLPEMRAPNARQYGAAMLFHRGCQAACPLPLDAGATQSKKQVNTSQ
eukprot:6469558-Amphidinium_carterae.2